MTGPDDEFVLNDLDKKIDESGTNGYYSTEGYYWDYKPTIKSVSPHLDDGYCNYTILCTYEAKYQHFQKECDVTYYYDAETNTWSADKITETVPNHEVIYADELEGRWEFDSSYSDSYLKGIFAGLRITITNISEEQGTMDLFISDHRKGKIYYDGTYDIKERNVTFYDPDDIYIKVYIDKSVRLFYRESFSNSGGPYDFVRIEEA